eukprot:6176974-Pleurochrysis_carterae.AAC.1
MANNIETVRGASARLQAPKHKNCQHSCRPGLSLAPQLTCEYCAAFCNWRSSCKRSYGYCEDRSNQGSGRHYAANLDGLLGMA